VRRDVQAASLPWQQSSPAYPVSVGVSTIDVLRHTEKQEVNFRFRQTNSVWYCTVLATYLHVSCISGVDNLKAASYY